MSTPEHTVSTKEKASYTIRPIEVSDVQATHELFDHNKHLDGFAEIDPYDVSVAHLSESLSALVAINEQGKVIGALVFDISESERAGNYLLVNALGVAPQHQGNIIGQNLIRSAIEVSERLHYPEVGTSASLVEIAEFYKQKCLFTVDPDGDDELELVLNADKFTLAKRTIDGQNRVKNTDVTLALEKIDKLCHRLSQVADSEKEADTPKPPS